MLFAAENPTLGVDLFCFIHISRRTNGKKDRKSMNIEVGGTVEVSPRLASHSATDRVPHIVSPQPLVVIEPAIMCNFSLTVLIVKM